MYNFFIEYLSWHFAACPNILKYSFLQELDFQLVVVFPRKDKTEMKIKIISGNNNVFCWEGVGWVLIRG